MKDFKCQGCVACCRIKDGIVRVGDDEVRRIAAFLGMSEQEFIDRETEIAPDLVIVHPHDSVLDSAARPATLALEIHHSGTFSNGPRNFG